MNNRYNLRSNAKNAKGEKKVDEKKETKEPIYFNLWEFCLMLFAKFLENCTPDIYIKMLNKRFNCRQSEQDTMDEQDDDEEAEKEEEKEEEEAEKEEAVTLLDANLRQNKGNEKNKEDEEKEKKDEEKEKKDEEENKDNGNPLIRYAIFENLSKIINETGVKCAKAD